MTDRVIDPASSMLVSGVGLTSFDEAVSQAYLCDEEGLVAQLVERSALSEAACRAISERAEALVTKLRSAPGKPPLIDQFLLEYGLSTLEGVLLMRLAEALLRTPDAVTRSALIRDRLGAGDWAVHRGGSDSAVVNLSTLGLSVAKTWISASGGIDGRSLIARLGDQVLRAAVGQAMSLMGRHFVLGRTIDEAIRRARPLRAKGFAFSYDMLGEAAITSADAARYFEGYVTAIKALAKDKSGDDGLSVKLSALHPRYELAQADTCVPELIEKVRHLALIAKARGLGLAIDAEEVERLEVSLHVISALIADPQLQGWDGLSVVVQAYQRRAGTVIERLASEARRAGRRIAIRLVKGAYWDSEIKRAQELGLATYPVFTRKENTDVSYLACARMLFDNLDVIYPQFATHNAHTASAILELVPDGARYEFQCLHGMGEGLHRALIDQFKARSRIYAPVGRHSELLPYLVRRLLENGANSSFVNQLFDQDVSVADITADPLTKVQQNASAQHLALRDPRDHLNGERLAAKGLDVTQASTLNEMRDWFTEASPRAIGGSTGGACTRIGNPADERGPVGYVLISTAQTIARAVESARASDWPDRSSVERAAVLRRAADQLEGAIPVLLPLIVREAGKTLLDAVGEIREAVDFCRYYADRAQDHCLTGRAPLGVVACISPWNFPLAIFLGQVAANLAVGNRVIAKPAEQTPFIAEACFRILLGAGVSESALHLIYGGGAVGADLVSHAGIDGVCFTGSTPTAKKIAGALAQTGRARAPLIAETGGVNAMIVDSTALLEQAVSDVVASAFQSAGQRCSACRVVCVQSDVADAFITMLAGAMKALVIGDPSDPATDIGPVIDAASASRIRDYGRTLAMRVNRIAETSLPGGLGSDLYIAPQAFEVASIAEVGEEIFGPVLHLVRFEADAFEHVIAEVNALGFGLTLGLHTRIDARITRAAALARVGNLYVNRNQIGAVVGVQPFGGEGLSGTGPKAGGPFYLERLTRNQKAMLGPALFEAASGGADLAPVCDLNQALIGARTAQAQWQGMDRVALMARMVADLAPDQNRLAQAISHFISSANSRLLEPRVLPGPTGESNELRFAPRGVLAAIFDGETAEALDAVLKALLMGNSVLLDLPAGATGAAFAALIDALVCAGAPDSLLAGLPAGMGANLLDAEIDGVIVSDSVANHIARHAALRDGAILPVIEVGDPVWRFGVERTITIDLTAAGGNATLLAAI